MAINRNSENPTSALKASGATGGDTLTEQLSSLAAQLEQLNATNTVLTQQALAYASPASAASSGGNSVLDTVESIIGGGLGLSSLASSLFGLFGGGNDAPPPITPFVAPLPIQANAGFSNANGGGPSGADVGQGNAPRAIPDSSQPTITVQVQAMDSRSFLDHSQEIALAVRQAMLESTVLNDVIRSV